MWYHELILLGLVNFAHTFWPASYKVDLSDEKLFVISVGGDDDDENDEMIEPQKSKELSSPNDDQEKYKALHSHVEHYNRRAAEETSRLVEAISHLQPIEMERHFADERKPFIAGYKHLLDEYIFDKPITETSAGSKGGKLPLKTVVTELANRFKRKNGAAIDESTETSSGADLIEAMNPRNHSHLSHPDDNPSFIETQEAEKYDRETEKSELKESEDEFTVTTIAHLNLEESEPAYDYEDMRAEYYQQVDEARSNNQMFNFTENEEPEEGAKDAIKKLVKFDMPKNCTKEELTQFGASALECLAFDYQQAKTKTDVRRVLARTWIILRVWICIYLCVAVPCWCQKGWCCCCFRCSICFPEEKILAAKNYYARNNPGVFVDERKRNGTQAKPIVYQPTLFELDAYDNLESAIRNL